VERTTVSLSESKTSIGALEGHSRVFVYYSEYGM
jgi:hypothetical protein